MKTAVVIVKDPKHELEPAEIMLALIDASRKIRSGGLNKHERGWHIHGDIEDMPEKGEDGR